MFCFLVIMKLVTAPEYCGLKLEYGSEKVLVSVTKSKACTACARTEVNCSSTWKSLWLGNFCSSSGWALILPAHGAAKKIQTLGGSSSCFQRSRMFSHDTSFLPLVTVLSRTISVLPSCTCLIMPLFRLTVEITMNCLTCQSLYYCGTSFSLMSFPRVLWIMKIQLLPQMVYLLSVDLSILWRLHSLCAFLAC